MRKLIKFTILIAVIVLVVEGYFVVNKIFSKYPKQRLCLNTFTCERYCLNIGAPVCEKAPTSNGQITFAKITSGELTVWNIIRPQQKYCSCNASGQQPKPKVFDQLNDFYSNNKK